MHRSGRPVAQAAQHCAAVAELLRREFELLQRARDQARHVRIVFDDEDQSAARPWFNGFSRALVCRSRSLRAAVW